MTWTVDSTLPITAANQQTEGLIRLHPGACADLRALLIKTRDPDEFLLPVGWTIIVAYEGDAIDYWYRAPTGHQWTDQQCGTAAAAGVFGIGSWLALGGLVLGGYLFWKSLEDDEKRRKTRKRR